jgi:predicted nucleic acid-binding protein
MRLYLDSNAIIYGIELVSPFHQTVIARILQAEDAADGVLLTSRLARLECRSKPLSDNRHDLLTAYDRFFTRGRLDLLDVSAAVIDRATDLRARYNLKTPDAIHLASAIEGRADRFLTGDAGLRRCVELNVETLLTC